MMSAYDHRLITQFQSAYMLHMKTRAMYTVVKKAGHQPLTVNKKVALWHHFLPGASSQPFVGCAQSKLQCLDC